MGGFGLRCLLSLLLVFKVSLANQPSITLMPEAITQNVGESVLVSCIVHVDQPDFVANMEWTDPNGRLIPNEDQSITILNGQNTPNQRDLLIEKLRREDAGVYKCSAMYAGNQKLEQTIDIQTYSEIDFGNTQTLQTPQLNSDAKIRCLVTADPPPVVDWLKDGVPITEDTRIIHQNDGILIKDITERDEGVYRCRARVTQLGRIKFLDIQVEVHVPPKITGSPKDVAGVEKESASFQCIATGKPPPQYSWVNKDSEVLNDKEGYFVDDQTGEFRILDIKPEHAGKYRCTASNAAGEDFAEATLRVLTKPNVERYLNTTKAEGDTAELRCEVSGDPLPEAVFKKESNEALFVNGVNEDSRIEVTQEIDDDGRRIGILSIADLTRKDDGLYTCSGNSSGGLTVAWGHITVEFKPTFEDQPDDEFWSWEQMPVNLTCHATSIPNATIEWYVREQPIREQDPNLKLLALGPVGILNVHPKDGSYFDTYTCKAVNTIGVTTHDVVLRQVQKPGPVSSVQMLKPTATTVSWSIRDPLDDGGLPVLGFSVQYRLENTGWDKSEHAFWPKDSQYLVDHLSPQSTYVFRFAARNKVGDGEWSGEKNVDMPSRTVPESPLIYGVDENKPKSIPYPNHYDLSWQPPLDNGEPIMHYQVIYYQVNNSTNGWGPVGTKEDETVPSPGPSTLKLQGLKSNSYYKIELRATNKLGNSVPSEAIIKTAYDPASATDNQHGPSVKLSSDGPSTRSNAPSGSVPTNDQGEDDGSNIGLIVAIVIIVLLILLLIVDVILYFAKNVGFTALLVSKLGTKSSEKDKEAMIENGGKQSAKADDNSNKEVDKESTVKDSTKEKECTETTPMITGETDKEAIKSEEKDAKNDKEEEEIKNSNNATANEALTKDSAV